MAKAPRARSTRFVIVSVTTMAMAMPIMPKRLPRRAVSWWDRPFRARMKRTLANRYQSAMALADIATLFLHSGVLLCRFLLLEHLQHPLGHEESAEGVDRDQRDRQRTEHRSLVDRTRSGRENRA